MFDVHKIEYFRKTNCKLMFRIVTIIISLLFLKIAAFSQCIEKKQIKYGGDYGFVNYIHLCPTYAFAFGGDTSRKWNVLNDPIDIKQAPSNALVFKKKVENAIKNYAGNDFYSNIKFQSVDVVYPERLKLFKSKGRQGVTLKYYKANYFYYYQFKPDTIAAYLIGIAVDKSGKILNPFVFPAKKNYKPIDKDFTYCKLVQIAKSKQKNIDPIESISLEFDTKSQRFLWLITQAIVSSHEGINSTNQVTIDAANLSIIEVIKSQVHIVF
jgi:hypothetical protein